MSNIQRRSETATDNESLPPNSVENRNRHVSSPDSLEADAAHHSDEDAHRANSWEPPSLFRTLTQQQRDDAHRKFTEQQSKPTRTIWHGLYDSYAKVSTSKILENTSSVARDHLAITQLFQLNSTQPNARQIGRAFGATFVLFSITFLYFANARYFHSQHAMIKGQFPASRGAVILGSSLLLAALVAMFAIILAT
ncbi:hypothetical protein INT44_004350 [Umbelopsis vinacea]|uniref:DUF202 domain-containing protein n=1 Tax=Umbelopsis vinacea TaxID=44442 RepID=A0A8H7QCK7_9FUNG|nr:hypothetical protein INT44_004350 [Umbelopsis vinacea]